MICIIYIMCLPLVNMFKISLTFKKDCFARVFALDIIHTKRFYLNTSILYISISLKSLKYFQTNLKQCFINMYKMLKFFFKKIFFAFFIVPADLQTLIVTFIFR